MRDGHRHVDISAPPRLRSANDACCSLAWQPDVACLGRGSDEFVLGDASVAVAVAVAVPAERGDGGLGGRTALVRVLSHNSTVVSQPACNCNKPITLSPRLLAPIHKDKYYSTTHHHTSP